MQSLLRLLSDRTRLRILCAVEGEELAVHEIADVLGMSQSRISNHLRLLKDGEALRGRREGASTFYRNALPDRAAPSALWKAVRQGLRGDPDLKTDTARRRAVLDRRRRRSREHFSANGKNRLEFELGTLREEILGVLVPSDLAVVDAGCGDGFLTEVLGQRFASVIAVDHSNQRLAAAKRRVTLANVTFQQGEIDDLPLSPDSADIAFYSLVLHHVPEIGAALREAARVLRPGGRIVIADLAPHHEESLRESMGDLRLGLDPEDLLQDMGAAGFVESRRYPVRDRVVIGRDKTLDLFLVTGERPATGRGRARGQKKKRRQTSQGS